MEKELKAIANELGAHFSFSEQKIALADGSRDQQFIYHINLDYKEAKLALTYRYGVLCLGDLEVDFKSNKNTPKFTISKNASLLSIFKKQTHFKIKCPKENQAFFLDNPHLKELYDWTTKSNFDPLIRGTEGQSEFNILTEFPTLFPERTEVVLPLFNFYKSCIDEFSVL